MDLNPILEIVYFAWQQREKLKTAEVSICTKVFYQLTYQQKKNNGIVISQTFGDIRENNQKCEESILLTQRSK